MTAREAAIELFYMESPQRMDIVHAKITALRASTKGSAKVFGRTRTS